MSEFEKAYQKTAASEGGYALVKGDRGGETYKGISRKFYPDWMGWTLIDKAKTAGRFPSSLDDSTLIETLVEKFYHDEFWVKPKIALIDVQSIADEVFDTAVNCGQKTAILFLQEAMNLCNQNGELYGELSVDGQLGINSVTAVNKYPNRRLDVLLGVLNLLQGERYLNICRKDPTQEKFLHGWVGQRILLTPNSNQSIH